MVQLPMPEHINESEVLESILPSKDVDGLTSTNLGKLFKMIHLQYHLLLLKE